MEGVSHEAIAIAGHLQARQADRALGRQRHLDRRQGFRSPTSVDQVERFKAAGWNARSRSTATTPRRSSSATRAAQKSDRPTLIACKTTIGFGAADQGGHHQGARRGASARRESPARARPSTGPTSPSSCPTTSLPPGATSARAARPTRDDGDAGCAELDPERRAEFERRMSGELPKGLDAVDRRLQAPARRSRRRRSRPARRARRRSTSSRRPCPNSSPARPTSPARTTPRSRRRRRSRPTTSRAATSTGASASTAWRRPATAWRVHGGIIPSGASLPRASPTMPARRCASPR